MTAKDMLQRVARRFGLEVELSVPRNSLFKTAIWHCEHRGIKTCLDVGAHTGGFARNLFAYGFKGQVISFEPVSASYAVLEARARRNPRWQIAPRGAVGAHNGTVEINVAANAFSSSLLPMMERHVEAAPDSHYVGRETVAMTTLDAWDQRAAAVFEPVFLKIDTQGYESEVMDGAASIMPYVQLLLVELATQPLYDGAPHYCGLIRRIEREGFALAHITRNFFDEARRQVLDLNALFVRN